MSECTQPVNIPPHRVQLRRTKGWRKPPNTVVVARPSKWGNPFKVGSDHQWPSGAIRPLTHEQAVTLFGPFAAHNWDVSELRGKNLACWCPLNQPCHADLLLDLANREVQ